MSEYFVCDKGCVFANQRWYPGDKMPSNYTKDGLCPTHFIDPVGYAKKKAEEAADRHEEEVKNRMAELRTDDPKVKKITQDVLNRSLGKKKIKVEKSPAENWKDGQKGPTAPPVAGPQPGSLISEKRGPGRPPKYTEDR